MKRTRGTIVRAFTAPDAMMRYALATAPDGRTYVVCSEGVGWEVTESAPLYVQTFMGGYELSLADVQDRAADGSDVDLADHVRTFGSRLESNFYMWSRRLSGRDY